MPPLAALLVPMVAATAYAAAFPSRPVRLMVPYPPGGGTDIVARALTTKLTEAWKQNIIVDNRAGGGGNIATQLLARSAPDGYTIGIVASTFAINASLYKNLPFDSVKDFAAVSQVTSAPYILVVHPGVAASSVPQLVALARAKPGALTYASTGSGGPPHLAAELFKTQLGIDILHVPYKGAAPAVIDLVGGQVQLMFASPVTALPHVRTRRLLALAVTTSRRFPAVSDLPTIAEAGVPGYEVDGWYGILAPAGTPLPILKELSGRFSAALRSPDIKERFASEGIEPVGTSPQEFQRYVKSEIEKWAKVVAHTQLKVD